MNETLSTPVFHVGDSVKISASSPVVPKCHTPKSVYKVASSDADYTELAECPEIKFATSMLLIARPRFEVNDVILVGNGKLYIIEEAGINDYTISHANSSSRSYGFCPAFSAQKVGHVNFRVGQWVRSPSYNIGLVEKFIMENGELMFDSVIPYNQSVRRPARKFTKFNLDEHYDNLDTCEKKHIIATLLK